MQGTKFDEEKIRTDLLPVNALMRIANIFTFGAKKYGAYNWEKGILNSRLYAACLRHLFAYWRGEQKDPESGMSHLHHAGCCIMMLIDNEDLRKELDDRQIKHDEN